LIIISRKTFAEKAAIRRHGKWEDVQIQRCRRHGARGFFGRLEGFHRIATPDKLLAEAIAVAERVSAMSRPIAMMVKEAVHRAFETTLAEGVRFERRLFHSTFATEDQKEGMAAFVAKRKPAFKNR